MFLSVKPQPEIKQQRWKYMVKSQGSLVPMAAAAALEAALEAAEVAAGDEVASFVISKRRRRVGMTVLSLAMLVVLFWCGVMPLISDTFRPPPILSSWPNAHFSVAAEYEDPAVTAPPIFPPERVYESNGYLMLYCNGGLNQMRAAICDMVSIARYLNLTLVVPELDKRSFWADASNFEDIFDVDHFINSIRDEVKIIKELPPELAGETPYSMEPVSWSLEKYYLEIILPLIQKHKVIRFRKTDARLANNGLPHQLQNLRCRVNYHALKFSPHIDKLGRKLISILKKSGDFVVLHLRYEMDMLSFSGCTHGCSDDEIEELTRMRYRINWWKYKEIISEDKRLEGLCPLTPEEASLTLQALGIRRNTTIYIAAGQIYGGERRMAALKSAFPKTVEKEMLLSSDELGPLLNHSSQMAALDYMVSLASDVFVPTYDGNMAKLVEGHRRYNKFQKSIIPNRKALVELFDLYQDENISRDQFSKAVMDAHVNRWGQPTNREVIKGQPKVEDYFYSNPQECLNSLTV